MLVSLFSFGMSIVRTIVSGYVFSLFWTWFIEPKVGISVSNHEAIGFMIFFSFLTLHINVSELTNAIGNSLKGPLYEGYAKHVDLITHIALVVAVYPIMLLSAYIWHLFL